MRYTLSRSGRLVAKENRESAEEFTNLPPSLRKQLSDIRRLKVSMDLNSGRKELMQRELVAKAEQAQRVMTSIPARIRHRDKKAFLEVVVKNYILQLESDELEYNLKLQEKLNLILAEEIRRLRAVCATNGLALSERGEEDFRPEPEAGGEDFRPEPEPARRENLSSVSPQRRFHKKLISNQSLYGKAETFERMEDAEKVASEKKLTGSHTELVLPPIREFATPKHKLDARARGQSRKSRERRQELSRVDQDVRNAINAITSLNSIGADANNERKNKQEAFKKQLKSSKMPKLNPKLPPAKEFSVKK